MNKQIVMTITSSAKAVYSEPTLEKQGQLVEVVQGTIGSGSPYPY